MVSKAYRFGIEEEYFLSDAESRGIARKISPHFIEAAQAAFPNELQREMLQSQIEVMTPICENMAQARLSLSRLRAGLAAIALDHDMVLLLPYLPLLLALSTSSPFWQGRRTGLMGYRLCAYAELPRTGLPELFTDPDEYRSYVAALVNSGAIKDESYIWWAMRPSMRHPTLELRIADSCTSLDDTLAIAALY